MRISNRCLRTATSRGAEATNSIERRRSNEHPDREIHRNSSVELFCSPFLDWSGSPRLQLYAPFTGLFKNGNRISFTHSGVASTVGKWGPTSLQIKVNLKRADQIWMEMYEISLGVHLNGNVFTYFTGWLLEEDVFLTKNSISTAYFTLYLRT